MRDQVDFLWRVLRRLGVWESDLADAAQQVFLVMNSKLADVHPGCERAFLFQTALRVASNLRRVRVRRREVSEELLLDEADNGPLPDERAEERRRRALLDQVLAALPAELRAVFVLVELEELTMAESAALLGVPPGTVASRLRRARAQFDERVRWLHQRAKERTT